MTTSYNDNAAKCLADNAIGFISFVTLRNGKTEEMLVRYRIVNEMYAR